MIESGHKSVSLERRKTHKIDENRAKAAADKIRGIEERGEGKMNRGLVFFSCFFFLGAPQHLYN